jgi:hypothetical protein
MRWEKALFNFTFADSDNNTAEINSFNQFINKLSILPNYLCVGKGSKRLLLMT